MAKTKKASRLPDIEILDGPVSEDHALVSTDTDNLRTFMGGLSSFFRRAGELEKAAKERLDIARQLKPPKTRDDDEKVQVVIHAAKLERKQLDEYWGIATLVSQLHRKLTGGRERGGKMLDEAAEIAQRLHNRYADDAKRAAKEEEDRLRREAEQRAREDRERELARAEAEATKLEESSPELSEREFQFTEFYTLDTYRGTSQGNAQVSAQRAGFADPMKAAARLMSNTKIQAAIRAKEDAIAIRRQAAATRELPLDVDVQKVRPAISRPTGRGHERVTYSGEVLSDAECLDAWRRGGLGIPADLFMVNPVKLNEYARSMHELIDRWPGVRHVKNTTTVS